MQRVGQALVVLVVLAGLAGVFGGGGLAKSAAESGPTRIEYPRFLRAHSPVEIRLSISGNAEEAGTTLVAVDNAFFDVYGIEPISPAPEKQTLGDNAIVYHFAHEAGARGPIILQVKATRMGLRSATITVGDQPAIRLRSFIFP